MPLKITLHTVVVLSEEYLDQAGWNEIKCSKELVEDFFQAKRRVILDAVNISGAVWGARWIHHVKLEHLAEKVFGCFGECSLLYADDISLTLGISLAEAAYYLRLLTRRKNLKRRAAGGYVLAGKA